MDDDLEAAVSVVLAFTREMNAWETRMFLKDRIHNGQFVPERDAQRVADASYEEIRNEYFAIFQRHCTRRERTYGGFPSGWSKGGQYAGVQRETVLGAALVGPRRAELIAKGGLFPNNSFKFVLFRTPDGWRIDNAFWSGPGPDAWERHHL
jgi:hypothetical protein